VLPNLPTVSELANGLGYTTSKARTAFKRRIQKAESQSGRQLLYGPKPLRVNVSELKQACPELFPVEYCRAAAELRAELKRSRRRQLQLESQMEQLAEASYALYENILDRIDHQRSPAITPRAMNEDTGFCVPSKPVASNPTECANDEPTQSSAPQDGADVAGGFGATAT
jgi:hypothetical protein